MNISIQRPTKIISMNIGGLKHGKMIESIRKKDTVPLDFYIINNVAEEDVSHAQEGMYGASVVSEFLNLVKIKVSSESSRTREFISRDNLDFIILSLKNDVRVRTFKSIDSSIKICFWTVEDAVTFYKQYFNLIEMSFMEDLGLDLRLADLSLECPHSITVPCQSVQDACQPNDALSELRLDAEGDCFEMKPFLSRHRLGISHNTELYKLQKDEFDIRVEYFNKMKPLFSKSDFKKMETALEGGCLDFVFKNCKELAVGSVSNVIVQKAIKHMNDDQICLLVKSFGYDIAPISATKYGAYTIQTLISASVTKASQNLISCYFEGSGRFLISHEIGNYSIQKILRFDREMIYDFSIRDLDKIIDNQLGFKVLKRCVPFFVNKKDLVLEKLESIETSENSERCRIIIDILNE